MSDGYTTNFSDIPYFDAPTNATVLAYGLETIAQSGNIPLSNPLPIFTFTAMIDPNRAVILRDESITSGGGLAQDITVDRSGNRTDVFRWLGSCERTTVRTDHHDSRAILTAGLAIE